MFPPLCVLWRIEGAVHVDRSGFRFTRRGEDLVPASQEFAAKMNGFGISPEATVVAHAEDKTPMRHVSCGPCAIMAVSFFFEYQVSGRR